MDLEELQTFVEVAHAGGLSPAAQRLGLSKSIVSRRLARLESELGVRLLARTTRGAALTDAGIAFRDHAVRIVEEYEAARAAITPGGDLRGHLRVAAPASFGPAQFAPVLAALARRHPLLHIHACYSDRSVDLIAEGFDCGIRFGPLQTSSLIARRVGTFHGKIVASPDYVREHGAPQTPDELAHHQVLMQGTERWLLVDGRKTLTVQPKGRFKADNVVALAAAAVAGLGLAYVPEGVADHELASGALIPVMTDYPPIAIGIYVVRPPDKRVSRKIAALTELLIEHFHRA